MDWKKNAPAPYREKKKKKNMRKKKTQSKAVSKEKKEGKKNPYIIITYVDKRNKKITFRRLRTEGEGCI